MKLTRTVAAMAALIVAPHGNATTDASCVQILDAQIADAKHAAIAVKKAGETICYNAAYAIGNVARLCA